MTYSQMLQMCCIRFYAMNSDHMQEIRSPVRVIEIIEARYRQKLVNHGSTLIIKLAQLQLLPKD